jgi:hypothetical protein
MDRYKYFEFRIGDDPQQILKQLTEGDSLEDEVTTEFVSLFTHYSKGAERLNGFLAGL